MKLLVLVGLLASALGCEDSCTKYAREGICTNGSSGWINWLKQNCRRSCGFCSASDSNCADICETKSEKCNDASWRDWMKKNCPKTCKYCVVPTKIPQTAEPSPPPGTNPPRTAEPSPPMPTDGPKPTLYPSHVQCGVSSVRQTTRVIGGKDAKPFSWPWQVGMYMFGRFGCGGSLVSSQWVTTAAHCTDGRRASQISVVLGDHYRQVDNGQEQKYRVSQIVQHPDYNRRTIANDISLLKLEKPAILNNIVRPVCLPEADSAPAVGTKCFITGWGKIKHPGDAHNTLQQAALPVVDNEICRKLNTANQGIPIEDVSLCAGYGPRKPQSGCHGDSGGPFVCQQPGTGRWTLHGAVSWGSPRCDTKGAYTVFARVAKFRKWIEQYIHN